MTHGFNVVVKESSSSCESIVISLCPKASQFALAVAQFVALYDPVILPSKPVKNLAFS